MSEFSNPVASFANVSYSGKALELQKQLLFTASTHGFAVCGSYALAMYGLLPKRKPTDIDICSDSWKNVGPLLNALRKDFRYIAIKNKTVFIDWNDPNNLILHMGVLLRRRSLEMYLSILIVTKRTKTALTEPFTISGQSSPIAIAISYPEDILAFKEGYGRQQDKDDIAEARKVMARTLPSIPPIPLEPADELWDDDEGEYTGEDSPFLPDEPITVPGRRRCEHEADMSGDEDDEQDTTPGTSPKQGSPSAT